MPSTVVPICCVVKGSQFEWRRVVSICRSSAALAYQTGSVKASALKSAARVASRNTQRAAVIAAARRSLSAFALGRPWKAVNGKPCTTVRMLGPVGHSDVNSSNETRPCLYHHEEFGPQLSTLHW